jgi:hypothetical protein
MEYKGLPECRAFRERRVIRDPREFPGHRDPRVMLVQVSLS